MGACWYALVADIEIAFADTRDTGSAVVHNIDELQDNGAVARLNVHRLHVHSRHNERRVVLVCIHCVSDDNTIRGKSTYRRQSRAAGQGFR